MLYQTLIVCILAAAFAGIPGFYISFRFNRSAYAATDKSFTQVYSGGFYFTFSGLFTGILFLLAASYLPVLSQAAFLPSFVTALSTGALAGLYGKSCGREGREAHQNIFR